MSDSLCPYGLQPTRLFCSWDSPGKTPLQGDLPDPGIELASLVSPALTGRFLPLVPPGKSNVKHLLGTRSWTKHVSSIYSCNLINWVLFYTNFMYAKNWSSGILCVLPYVVSQMISLNLCLYLSDFKFHTFISYAMWPNKWAFEEYHFCGPTQNHFISSQKWSSLVNSRKSRTALFLSAISCLQVTAWEALVCWLLKTVTNMEDVLY